MTVDNLFENGWPEKVILFRTEHHEIVLRTFTKIDSLSELVLTFSHLEFFCYIFSLSFIYKQGFVPTISN